MIDIEELLFRELQGTLTEAEKAQLDAWMAERPENREWASQLQQPATLTKKLRLYADHQQEAARQEAIRHLFPISHNIHWKRWWAAAAILILLAAGGYWYQQQQQPMAVKKMATVIAAGHNGAILTLANGNQLLLDTVRNGVIALQGGVTARVVNGTLRYEGNGSGEVYNTMSIPKGRLFQLSLPDGTTVWLNSASTIRYPIAFNGKERRVFISGEAYFEVAPNANQPFIVAINQQGVVKVLGTRFNVHAYDNEPAITTTLLDGAVQVNAAVTLQPGQQAIWQQGATATKLISHANIDKVMAWKNGLFDFDGASLPEVMRQLERWYDIEVVFEKPIPDITFGGKMTKGIPLNEMLEILKSFEGADLRFRMEGEHTLIVSQ